MNKMEGKGLGFWNRASSKHGTKLSHMTTAITPGMITTDCSDARALAKFWSEATGAPISADYDGFFVMVDTTPTLGFQLVEDPTPGKNRIHIDFQSQDREAAVKRLEELGATVQSVETLPDGSFTWTVMADPEGNLFCVGEGH
jgi:hypothetical protein